MENRKYVKFIIPILLPLLFLAGSRSVFAYATETHAYLTSEVFKFYNANFSNQPLAEELKDYLVDGSRREDDIPRWMNHFYDPVYHRGLSYDPAIDPAINLGTWQASKLWAGDDANQNQLTYKVPAAIASVLTAIEQRNLGAVSSETDFTWNKAIEYWAEGNKEKAMFILGHVLHLIEDASVPDHTRNDPHPGDSPYEQWTGQFNLNHPDDNLTARLENKKPVLLSDLGSYFDAVATYSNNNFYSKDTIGIQSGYKLPEPDYFSVTLNGTFAVKINNSGNYYLYRKIGNDSYFLESKFSVTLKDDLVDNGYWSLLSPKAVGYAAGAVNLFFKEAEAARNNPQLMRQNQPKGFLASAADAMGGAASAIGNTVHNVISLAIGLFASPTGAPAISPTQTTPAAPANPAAAPSSDASLRNQNLRAQLDDLARQLAALSETLGSGSPAEMRPASLILPATPTVALGGGGSDAVILANDADGGPATGGSGNGNATSSDNNGGAGGSSSTSTASSTPDIVPPAAVSDLRTADVSTSSLVLLWTAPGDDGASGTASAYDIRYSTGAITDDNWDNAVLLAGIPAPLIAGSSQSMFVAGLSADTSYYFALKSTDEIPNVSGPSNVIAVRTLAPPPPSPEASVVISEILFNASGSDEGKEFVELYNPTDNALDLAGWSLRYRRGDSTSTASLASFKTSSHPEDIVTIKPKGFLLVGLSDYDAGNYNNKSADILRSASLPNGKSGGEPEAVRISLLDNDGNEADAADYDSNSIAAAGQSLERKAKDGGGNCVSPRNEGEFLGNGCDKTRTGADFEVRETPNPQNSRSLPEPRTAPAANSLRAVYSPAPKIDFSWDASTDALGATSTLSYSIYDVSGSSSILVFQSSLSSSTSMAVPASTTYSLSEVGRPYDFRFSVKDREGLAALATTTVSAPSFLDQVYFYEDPRPGSGNYLVDITTTSSRPFWDKSDRSNNQNWKLIVFYLNEDAPKEELLSTENNLTPQDKNFLSLNYKGCNGGGGGGAPALLLPWNVYSCQGGGLLSGAFNMDDLEDPRLFVKTAAPADGRFSADDFVTAAFYDFGWGGNGAQRFLLAAVDKNRYHFRTDVPAEAAPASPGDLAAHFDETHSVLNLFWSGSADSDTPDRFINYEVNYSSSSAFDDAAWQPRETNLWADLPVVYGNNYKVGVRAVDDFGNVSIPAAMDWSFPDGYAPLPAQRDHGTRIGFIDGRQKFVLLATTTIDAASLWLAADEGWYNAACSNLALYRDQNGSPAEALAASPLVCLGRYEGDKEVIYRFSAPLTLGPGAYWLVPAAGPADRQNANGSFVYGSSGDGYPDGFWSGSPGRDAYFVLRRAQ